MNLLLPKTRTKLHTLSHIPATLSLFTRQTTTQLIVHHKTPRLFTTSTSLKTNPIPRQEYLVVIPDHPGTSIQRAKAQPKHIEKATPMIDDGILTYFGVTLSKHDNAAIDASVRSEITGSAIVMKAESEDVVRKYLENDPYTIAGVWDVSKARIWPFRSG